MKSEEEVEKKKKKRKKQNTDTRAEVGLSENERPEPSAGSGLIDREGGYVLIRCRTASGGRKVILKIDLDDFNYHSLFWIEKSNKQSDRRHPRVIEWGIAKSCGEVWTSDCHSFPFSVSNRQPTLFLRAKAIKSRARLGVMVAGRAD